MAIKILDGDLIRCPFEIVDAQLPGESSFSEHPPFSHRMGIDGEIPNEIADHRHMNPAGGAIMTSQNSTVRRVPAEEIGQANSRTLRFEGQHFGSDVSFFMVNSDPGRGADLHRHPYGETWHVIDGDVEFVVGETVLRAGTGDTSVAPTGEWHKFTNVGNSPLVMMCIHASAQMIQEDASELEP